MGFITLYEMEAFNIVTLKNYREVGLETVNGRHLGAFNAHWNVWQPNLGLGSMMGFGHLQCSFLPFAPVQYGECDFHEDNRYEKCLGFIAFVVCL